MNARRYDMFTQKVFTPFIAAILLLAAGCGGGTIIVDGEPVTCLADFQCPEGSTCQSDGTCSIVGEDAVIDVSDDLPEVLDVTDDEAGEEQIECVPTDEICDGIDNDCDGEVDEELGSSTCGFGACEVTVENCLDGMDVECIPGEPADEMCDGIDNDCNDLVDDELGATTCGVGACEMTVENCVEGVAQECVPGEPADEMCDGVDNDCNGEIDEELGTTTCGVGACEMTVDNCVEGEEQECVPGEPMDEVCDGIDNDCNELVDDELAAITCGVGACVVEVENCIDGVPVDCVPGEPTDEVCDGIDNDCNELVDDELGTTTCGVGACEMTVDNCVEGNTQECIPGEPTNEECDEIDNDCDGEVDDLKTCNDYTISGRAYDVDGGEVLPGTTISLYPAGACDPDGEPTEEPILVVVTDEAGIYWMNVVPGDYCLEATLEGYDKKVSEDFTLGEEERRLVSFGLEAIEEMVDHVAVCGIVTDADTGLPLGNASVKLGGNALGNVVAATTTDEDGGYCLGGALLLSAQDWYLGAFREGYFPGSEGPLAFMANTIHFVDFALVPDVAGGECFIDGFEVDLGWIGEGPSEDLFWQVLANGVLLNASIPDCVTLAPAEDCMPEPWNPDDTCPICGTEEEAGCIPEPGALPRAHTGEQCLWFGNPASGNYLPADGQCADLNGGSGGPSSGTFTSPAIPLVAGADELRIVFWYWFEIEGVDPNTNYERMSVQVSADGMAFTEIGVLNPDFDTDGDPDKGFTSAGYFAPPSWALADLAIEGDVAEEILMAEMMYVRLSFDTGDSLYNGFRGWLVDDLKVVGQNCSIADCPPEGPTPEICDGIDNNCNGIIDDGIEDFTCGIGECEVTIDSCIDGIVQECVPGDPVDEICDGLDNDCNEFVDDGLCDDMDDCTADMCDFGNPDADPEGCLNINQPVDCQISDWTDWEACIADPDLTCSGTQIRTRTVTVQPECGGMECPALEESQACDLLLDEPCDDEDDCTTGDVCDGMGGCAGINQPVDCEVSAWGEWDACAPMPLGSCTGEQDRTRTITVAPECGGMACPALDETQACNLMLDADCDDSDLCTLFDKCDGNGNCIGAPAEVVPEAQGGCDDGEDCTEDTCSALTGCVNENQPVDCVVGQWTDWTVCQPGQDGACTGEHDRSRIVVVEPMCGGDECPVLMEIEGCNVSAQEGCNDGIDCTVSDHCDGNGGCSGNPADGQCNDQAPCTIDACAPGAPGAGPDGCTHTPNPNCCNGPGDCVDGEECTEDLCVNNSCSNPPVGNGVPCSGGSCDGAGSCVGACSGFDYGSCGGLCCPGQDNDCFKQFPEGICYCDEICCQLGDCCKSVACQF